MAKKANKKMPVNWWRRIAQVLVLALFLFLFRKTDYQGADHIPYAVNLFFRFDPLVAVSAMLASKAFISLVWPAIITVILTLVLGRFFCGWVCPLGTLLDGFHKLVPARHEGQATPRRRWKYYLLLAILAAALFGFPLSGYFDPFSILVRGLALSVDPAVNHAAGFPFDIAYKHGPGWLSSVTEPVYAFLRDTLLPYKQSLFALSIPTLITLLAVFALERIERRFWCRNLCPLGALLGLVSRLSFLRWRPGKACDLDCMTCAKVCRMGAIDHEGRISPEACNLCLDCVVECDKQVVSFRFKRPRAAPAGFAVSRRGALGSLAFGAAMPVFMSARVLREKPEPYLIRPPGALSEPEFLSRCIRCGECMKVCINNALQPAFIEAGAGGMWSPVLVPRVGYCEYNCTLCGQVCPTGAIRELRMEEKHTLRIGTAWFDSDRCLPWAKGITCLVCEEMCPVPDKAIKMREGTAINQQGEKVSIKQPYVVDDLCIGCGECENKCPVPGESAVRVTRQGESRDPDGDPY